MPLLVDPPHRGSSTHPRPSAGEERIAQGRHVRGGVGIRSSPACALNDQARSDADRRHWLPARYGERSWVVKVSRHSRGCRSNHPQKTVQERSRAPGAARLRRAHRSETVGVFFRSVDTSPVHEQSFGPITVAHPGADYTVELPTERASIASSCAGIRVHGSDPADAMVKILDHGAGRRPGGVHLTVIRQRRRATSWCLYRATSPLRPVPQASRERPRHHRTERSRRRTFAGRPSDGSAELMSESGPDARPIPMPPRAALGPMSGSRRRMAWGVLGEPWADDQLEHAGAPVEHERGPVACRWWMAWKARRARDKRESPRGASTLEDSQAPVHRSSFRLGLYGASPCQVLLGACFGSLDMPRLGRLRRSGASPAHEGESTLHRNR